jgi:RNA polymerase sigma factor (sigma-70 family)
MNKDEVIKEYYGLVKKIASQYAYAGVPFEDLTQEGLLGLLEAAERFQEDKEASFSTYAAFWIKKYIFQALENEKKTSLYAGELIENEQESPTTEPVKQNISLPPDMPSPEKEVLTYLFEEQLSLSEIAEKMKLPREKVRQLKEKGLRRMKKEGIR